MPTPYVAHKVLIHELEVYGSPQGQAELLSSKGTFILTNFDNIYTYIVRYLCR
jgi:hypothetical protein